MTTLAISSFIEIFMGFVFIARSARCPLPLTLEWAALWRLAWSLFPTVYPTATS